MVIVSAIPLQSDTFAPALDREPMVTTVVPSSWQVAEETRDTMVKALAEQLRDSGRQVPDMEVE